MIARFTLFITLFFGASFSSSATISYMWNGATKYAADTEGMISAIVGSCTYSPRNDRSQSINSGAEDGYLKVRLYYTFHSGEGCSGSVSLSGSFLTSYRIIDDCPAGTEINTSTGRCEEDTTEPEPCQPGYIRNEVGLCVVNPDDDFCDTDFIGIVAEASNACATQYPNHFTNVIPTCTSRANYSIQCVQGFPKPTDPTSPVNSPNSSFGGGSAGTANPNNTEFDKPEADSVPTNETSDTAVVGAVRNLNSDVNKALNGLNQDINSSFADVNNQLTQLNGTNQAIGQAIVDQMNQDYAIYQGNKALMMQQTGAISSIGSGISSAVGQSSDKIAKAIGEQTDALSKKLDELNNECDPNQDARSCEGKHNLDDHLTSAIVGQMNTAVEESLDSAQSELVEQAQAFAVDAGVSTIRSHIDEVFDYFIGSLPSISNCTSFSLPSPLGGEISFGCEFSVKFKALFSFLLYIYTVGSCLNILLNGLTPVAPAMTERYYHK